MLALFIATLAAHPAGAPAAAGSVAVLTSRVVRTTRPVSDSLIVGRAVCNDRVWLLTETREITEIAVLTATSSTHQIRGLLRDDRPWGLACLNDGTLWMLPDSHALARVTTDGQVAERLPLKLPAIALFGAGDRLLLQSMPPVVAIPLLASAPPRRPADQRPWPGLVGRASPARTDLFAQNLVTCGIAARHEVPCWFADETHVTVSDGFKVRRLSFPFVQAADTDRAAPIRDVALIAGGRAWILGTSLRPTHGRRSGGRLLLTADGRELARLDLVPEARLIIAAGETTCLLLTVTGEILEVHAR
jgi:hypothetical protein